MTLVLYRQEADGTDKTEPLKYTVSDGKASVTYNGNKITTTAIADNTFTASLDGTDATKCSFSTTKGTKLPPTTPSDPDTPSNPDTPTDPDTPAANPFAGKTFYGSMTFNEEGFEGTYDVAEITFTDTKLTLILYGADDDGSDVEMTASYTVADGRATMTDGENSVTTSAIENDTFTASLDGTEEMTCTFSTEKGTKLPASTPSDPDTPPVEETILDNAAIIGTISGWNPKKMTKADDTTYTYKFTANDASGEFSIQEVSGSWATRWCGNDATGAADNPATTAITPGEGLAAMVYSTAKNPTHVQLKGLQKNSEYEITVVIVDSAKKEISCKIELTKAGEVDENAGPLDDFVLKGDFDDFGDGIKLTRTDGNSYTVDLTATAAKQELKITTASWSPAYCVDAEKAVISMDLTDSDVKWYKGDSGMSNPTVTGLEIGSTYTLTIVCSEDESYVTVNIVKK